MKRITELRKARGLSQEELAAMAGVRPATISSIVNTGKGNLETLEKIASALGVHLLDLFEDDRDDPGTQALITRVRALGEAEKEGLARILPRPGSR